MEAIFLAVTGFAVSSLDWDGSPLYGQPLEIDFLTRLRSVERFENVEALKTQLVRDIESARRVSREFTKNP